MARSVVKICKTCGTAFDSPLVRGQASSTVNCPRCRSKKRSGGGGAYSGVNKSYDPVHGDKFRCKVCKRIFNKGDGLRHRRKTGHVMEKL